MPKHFILGYFKLLHVPQPYSLHSFFCTFFLYQYFFKLSVTKVITSKNMLLHMMSTMPQQNLNMNPLSLTHMKLQNLHTRRNPLPPFQYINLQCTKNLIEPCHLAINNFAMAFESVVFFDQEGFHLFYYSR